MIWGICGGVARYLDVDPTVVRIITVISLLFGTAGFWAYIVMRILVPEEPYA
jgi:phage shock protein PspC (stress-responsive transcriptional regulator)